MPMTTETGPCTVVVHFDAPFQAGLVADWEQLAGDIEGAQALARYILQHGLEVKGLLVPWHRVRGVHIFPGDVRGIWHDRLPR
jgi:hypothetical protein